MRDLIRGMRLLAEGQRWAIRHGRDWRFGMIPAVLTLVGYAAALVVLALWGVDFVGWATPFADHWASPWAGLFRGLLTALLFGGGLLVAVISFTAVTLLVGQPFYEALAERVDRAEGGAPEPPDRSLWRELWISAVDSLYVLVRVAAFGIVLFAAGFLPVVGQTVVPVIGFCVSGFFLAVELSSVAFQRRDVPMPARVRLLRGRLPLALGFGVPLVLAFLVPFVAVLLMPGAVAGATLLARECVPPEPEPEPGPRPDGGQGEDPDPGNREHELGDRDADGRHPGPGPRG
ncbi:EI24 domain-containing protein [Actinacidiphila acidipaludis]|uniref:EI24 domain-containing protein n=1 Tax=Actinacidiphila acidipaludis TaxID=2873382 RepID=A0ABS7Q3A6_9ACTN|nr:EI24 domain-containing protein [Streptomyces acidipaludis]MBY8877631.1 EI24 domain-containing protein [Streptomyces acidipaludis]